MFSPDRVAPLLLATAPRILLSLDGERCWKPVGEAQRKAGVNYCIAKQA